MPPALLALARAAVAAALAVQGGEAELLDLAGPVDAACAIARADVPRPVAASGRAALHLEGTDAAGRACGAWLWARVRVTVPALVTIRAVAAGEPLGDAVRATRREAAPGDAALASLPEGGTAARALPAGAVVDLAAVRVGPAPGAPVSVVLRAGALEVEQRASAVACRRGRACALLPTGRVVEGRWHGGRIELDPS